MAGDGSKSASSGERASGSRSGSSCGGCGSRENSHHPPHHHPPPAPFPTSPPLQPPSPARSPPLSASAAPGPPPHAAPRDDGLDGLGEAEETTNTRQYVQYNLPGGWSVVVSNEYRVTKMLGSGAYGVVVEAESLADGAHYAVKKIAVGKAGDSLNERLISTERALRELQLVSYFDYETIVSLRDVIRPRDHDLEFCYVMDLMSTDLGSVLHPRVTEQDYLTLRTPAPDCGAKWDRDNVLLEVVSGSHADQCGFSRMVGRRGMVFDNRTRYSSASSHCRYDAEKNTKIANGKSIRVGFEPVKQRLEDINVKTIMWCCLDAFAMLHACGVIHRDAKPQNILVSEDGSVKLCDFGLARELDTEASLTSYVETRWYRAPELLVDCKHYDAKVDVWSLGCIFAELLHPHYDVCLPGGSTLDQLHLTLDRVGKPTEEELQSLKITNEKTKEAILNWRSGKASSMSIKHVTSDPVAQDLLKHMLKFIPGERYTVKQCMDHEYFSDYKADQELTEEDYTFEGLTPFSLLSEGNTPCLVGKTPEQSKRARLRALTKELILVIQRYHSDYQGECLLSQIDELVCY